MALVCLPSYSYSESITPYYGTTGNAASGGNTWSMDNVLPVPPGLDINGVIYDMTFIINDNLQLPTLFKNIDNTNITTLVNLIKHSENFQDLYIIFESIEAFDIYVNTFKEANPTKVNLVNNFVTNNIDTTKTSEEQLNQKKEKFNKFKYLFLLSISQFKVGIICPAGLRI